MDCYVFQFVSQTRFVQVNAAMEMEDGEIADEEVGEIVEEVLEQTANFLTVLLLPGELEREKCKLAF